MGYFMPYLYVPSAEASYVKLVTPWGNVKMNKGFMEQLAVSVGVVVLTLLLWRCSARLNMTLKKKADKKKAKDKKKKAEGEDGDEEEEEEEEEEDDSDPRSVPDENKVKKGDNSYYYSREVKGKSTVSSYGWTDSKETISIFLTDSAVKNMKKEQLALKWTNMSLSMDLLDAPGGDQVKSLEISTLFHEITDVKWEATKDTLTVTLTKAQEMPWKSLNGAAKTMEEHIQYDDSFFD